jgi:hypothetical protein
MGDRLDVRRLGVEDAASFMAVRREALQADPLAFSASIDDDFALNPEFVRRSLTNVEEQAVFGYFESGRLQVMGTAAARAPVARSRHRRIPHGARPSRRNLMSDGIGRSRGQDSHETQK